MLFSVYHFWETLNTYPRHEAQKRLSLRKSHLLLIRFSSTELTVQVQDSKLQRLSPPNKNILSAQTQARLENIFLQLKTHFLNLF